MKRLRQQRLLEILAAGGIRSQADLAARLREEGFAVTQATVSRDVKELGLVKVPLGDGSYCYTLAPAAAEGGSGSLARLRRVLADSLVGMDYSENILVLHTLPGAAHTVGSCLDQQRLPGVIGTVAGDDTLLLVVKPRKAVQRVKRQLEELMAPGVAQFATEPVS